MYNSSEVINNFYLDILHSYIKKCQLYKILIHIGYRPLWLAFFILNNKVTVFLIEPNHIKNFYDTFLCQ